VTLRARWVTLRARWVTLRDRWVTLRARWVTLRARWVTPRDRWVTLRARRVTLSARLVTLRYRWVTLRARWVTLRARWVTLDQRSGMRYRRQAEQEARHTRLMTFVPPLEGYSDKEVHAVQMLQRCVRRFLDNTQTRCAVMSLEVVAGAKLFLIPNAPKPGYSRLSEAGAIGVSADRGPTEPPRIDV
jgi:hypothetical protein